MTDIVRVTDDWESFIKVVAKKLQVSSLATGYYQVLESEGNKVILRASVGELGYEGEILKDEVEKKVEQLKSLLKGKSDFIKIKRTIPNELFYS